MKSPLLPVLLAACPLAGQAISLTVSAATPLTTRATAGGTTNVHTLPIGPVPASGYVFAAASQPPGELANMSLNWITQLPGQSERLLCGCSFLGMANGLASPASASVDPFEMLLHLQAPTPRRVFVTGRVVVVAPPGLPAPQLELDLFDDGTVEWSTTVLFGTISVLVGPTPIPVRVRGAVSLPSNGFAQGAGTIDITPDNRVDSYAMVQGCLAEGFLRLEDAFAHDGVRLQVPAGCLCVGVLGLGVQPLVLSVQGGLPCLLLPSPDVLVVIPANGFDLPIPAAARPIDFYAQAVWFDFQGLPTTTGYRVSAF